MVLKRKLLENF